jgi:hypothetical protein
VDQVERGVAGMDDRESRAVRRQLAQRLAQSLGDERRVVAERPGQRQRAQRHVRPRQDDATQTFRGDREEALAGDPVGAVGEMVGVILERTQRHPGDRGACHRRGDLGGPQAVEAHLGRGHRVLVVIEVLPISRSGTRR